MRAHDDDRSLPFISVVMPVRNEAASIERTLDCLLKQQYDPLRWEVLVVDGDSSDGTAELAAQVAAEHPAIRIFDNPRRLSSAARNIGIRQARGDVVVIVDGHCEIGDTGYLRKLAAAFQQSNADCIGRPQPLDVCDATPLQRAIAAARNSWLGHHPQSHVYSNKPGIVPAKSVAVAYRRSVFDRVGYFDERFDACEDVELNHRIDVGGLRCFFTPDVAVTYRPRASLRGLFVQMMRYGRGRVRLLRKHPSTLSFGSLLPLALVVGLSVGLPLGLAAPGLAVIYAAAAILYLVILLVGAALISLRQRRGRLLPWLPPVLLAIHLGAGMGMLLELLRPGDRRGAGTR